MTLVSTGFTYIVMRGRFPEKYTTPYGRVLDYALHTGAQFFGPWIAFRVLHLCGAKDGGDRQRAERKRRQDYFNILARFRGRLFWLVRLCVDSRVEFCGRHQQGTPDQTSSKTKMIAVIFYASRRAIMKRPWRIGNTVPSLIH
nr:hypothetical protein CFP56_09680 [Quercus suber]